MSTKHYQEVLVVNEHIKLKQSDAKPIRIIHISDTHLHHDRYLDEGLIPDGDILIHSGDFDFYRHARRLFPFSDFQDEITKINTFFARLPHKHKLFVGGNHETNFQWYDPKDIQSSLTNCTYLQDSFVDIEGIRIYGSPWTGFRWFSFARAFTSPYAELYKKWELIPDKVDVLVTHSPPLGIMDLAGIRPWMSLWMAEDPCDVCDTTHVLQRHIGSRSLLDTVLNRIRPKVHLFGHVHEFNDSETKDDIIFSNAVMKGFAEPRARIIDYFVENDRNEET